MAKTHKSIWEIRFQAIEDRARQRIRCIKSNIANTVLYEKLPIEELNKIIGIEKVKLKIYENLLSDTHKLRNAKAERIWLEEEW